MRPPRNCQAHSGPAAAAGLVSARPELVPGPRSRQERGLLYPTCSTLWDYDGAGPQPPSLVAGISSSGVVVSTGTKFVSLGGVPVGQIRSLAVYNSQLYVGGSFSKLGTDVVNNVARWDGAHWVPLGTGMTGAGNPGNPTGSVNSMVVYGGQLCIGGTFVPVSTGTWNSFATWNGTTLTAGLSTPAPISQLLVNGGLLYTCTTATFPGVFRFDTSAWTLFGTLADRSILALTVFNGDLICGGEFTNFFTGDSIVGIARWTGTQWAPMGSGASGAERKVATLTNYLGRLIAGGRFTSMGGVPASNIASWDGLSWSGMVGGLTPYLNSSTTCVAALAPVNGDLHVFGNFVAAGGFPDTCLVRWNGSSWLPYTSGINGRVRALLSTGSAVYAGGDFQFDRNGVAVPHVFGSDGSTVSVLGTPPGVTGVNGPVTALGLHSFDHFGSSDVIVGGSFTQAGGLNASNIATYSSTTGWAPLGNGLNSTVTAVANLGSTLYAAGYFTASGAVLTPHLAKYGSTGWVDPGAGSFDVIYAMTNSNGKLILGGVPGGEGVSSWDGSTLTVLATADGSVFALATFQGDIVAAGPFTTIGGQAAAGIARRSSATGAWSGIGAGFSLGTPFALAEFDGTLYAGGTFLASGGTSLRRIARWNGFAWTDPVGGLDGAAFALASLGNRLYVGGDFQQSNNHVASPWLIAYNDGVVGAEPSLAPAAFALGPAYPNPARGRTTVEFSLAAPGPANCVIHDVAGRAVRTLVDGWFEEAGAHTLTWDGRDGAGRPCAAGVLREVRFAGTRELAKRGADAIAPRPYPLCAFRSAENGPTSARFTRRSPVMSGLFTRMSSEVGIGDAVHDDVHSPLGPPTARDGAADSHDPLGVRVRIAR